MIRKFPQHDGFQGIQLYKIMRPYMMVADVLEWDGDNPMADTIQYFTKKDVNHTGGVIVFNEFCKDRVFTAEATARGFALTYLSRALERYKGKVYLLPLKHEYDIYRIPVASAQLEMIGIPYDFKSLFKNAVSRVSEDMRELFCSEGIGASYRRFNLIKPDYMEGKALRPGDFAGTGLFQERIRIF